MSIRTDPITLPAADPVRLRVNKLELLERLADDLAHEIKNPLHSMVINLEVLKRRAARVSGEGAEDLQRYAGVLAAELERVNRRIELLLRLSRPARGAELATLGELVEELMELIQLEARHHEVEVDYHPGERAVRVRLPRETGRQILLNLVLDALKGAGPGARLGLSLGHSHDQAHLSVTCGGGQPAAREGDPDDRLSIVAALVAGVGGTLEDEGVACRRVTLPLAHG